MSSTALGAESVIIFISEAHERFYYEKLKEVRYQDVYHKALVYCLGISDDTRRNIKSIYDFKTSSVSNTTDRAKKGEVKRARYIIVI